MVVDARLGASDISAQPNIMIFKENGTWPMDHYANPDYAHPTIYADPGKAAIRISVLMPSQVYYPAGSGTLMNAGAYLTAISYRASWKNNQTIIVDSDNFNLTNIPFGDQQIEVFASCNVLLFDDGFSSTYPVPQSGSHAVNFTVAPIFSPTPSATPTSNSNNVHLDQQQSFIIAFVAVLAIAIIILAFYKRGIGLRKLNQAE
jgi:hypothetical protein